MEDEPFGTRGRRPALGARALHAAATELHLDDLALGGFSSKLHGSSGQAADIAAFATDQVRVTAVIRARNSRQLEAPDLISELSTGEHASVCKGEQVPVDRSSVETAVGHLLSEFRMTYR